MLKLFRPLDPLWLGIEEGPHVGTIIPTAETRIQRQDNRPFLNH
jgi:hypothetical protein